MVILHPNIIVLQKIHSNIINCINSLTYNTVYCYSWKFSSISYLDLLLGLQHKQGSNNGNIIIIFIANNITIIDTHS